MAPRQDLILSAVEFLRDPSVASSPIEKRIEFLKSKNLTQEEIDLALGQADGQLSQQPRSPNAPPFYSAQQQRPPPSGYDYGYGPYGQWPQQAPPEPPRRDWRDWFIMATVVGGASYGIYVLAQRYIKPLIAPPTPPQLEQDKAAIDEQFNKAFALLDTLSQDTEALKKAEEARTTRLDSAIEDIETIVADLKAASLRREDDSRRMEAEVKNMKDSLPRALDTVREGSERQLKELSTELASLKALMGNRMGNTSNPVFAAQTRPQDLGGVNSTNSGSGTTNTGAARTAIPTPMSLSSSEVTPGSKGNVTGVNGTATAPSFATPTNVNNVNTSSTSAPSSAYSVPASSTAVKPPSSSAAKYASIPAWQMAAQNKADSASNNNSASTGNPAPTTTPPQTDGADAVAALMNSSAQS